MARKTGYIIAGTVIGGKKAGATNKERYGKDFYVNIGKLGGERSKGGGFAKIPGLAREAGRKGGLATRDKLGWKKKS